MKASSLVYGRSAGWESFSARACTLTGFLLCLVLPGLFMNCATPEGGNEPLVNDDIDSSDITIYDENEPETEDTARQVTISGEIAAKTGDGWTDGTDDAAASGDNDKTSAKTDKKTDKKDVKSKKEEFVNKFIKVDVLEPAGGEILKGGSRIMVKWKTTTDYKLVEYDVKILSGRAKFDVATDVVGSEAYVRLPGVTTKNARVEVSAKVHGKIVSSSLSEAFTVLTKVQSISVSGPGITKQVPFDINFDYPDPNFIAKVKIYYRPADSLGVERNWVYYGEASGAPASYKVSLPDAVYDFYFAAEDILGNRTSLPSDETPPQLRVTIDTIPPEITFLKPVKNERLTPGTGHKIEYKVRDKHLRMVDFYYSVDSGINWIPLRSASLESNELIWRVPVEISNKCLLKAVCVDMAGNVSETKSEPFEINYTGKLIDLAVETKQKAAPAYIGCKLAREFVKHDGVLLFYSTDKVDWYTSKTFAPDERLLFSPPKYGKYYIYAAPVKSGIVMGSLPSEHKGNFEMIEFASPDTLKYTLKADIPSIVRGGSIVESYLNGDLSKLNYVIIRLLSDKTVHELGSYKPADTYKIRIKDDKDMKDCRLQFILRSDSGEDSVESQLFDIDSSPPLLVGVELVK